MLTSRGGVLRIHFSLDDVARTRIAAGADVLWETVLSMHLLQNGEGKAVFGAWRQEALTRVDPSIHFLLPLNPARGYFPDFLTPTQGVQSLNAGLDAVLSTPRTRLRGDLKVLATENRLPSWVADVADGDPNMLTRVGAALRRYHEAVIAPAWPAVTEQVEAERARRGRALLDGGFHGLLDSLRPMLRWNPPVLEVDYPSDHELHLGGRGLILVPSFFCWRLPVTLLDAELPPVLVYPIEHHSAGRRAGADEFSARAAALAALIGHTRAAVLEAISDGCTTTELARRGGTSLATASQHASVLRNAGLISTRRVGSAVLHSLTPLGAQLLTS